MPVKESGAFVLVEEPVVVISIMEELVMVVLVVEEQIPVVEVVVEKALAAFDEMSPTDTDATTHASTKPFVHID